MSEKKRKFILRRYPTNFWHVADLEIHQDGEVIKTFYVNKFYRVTDEWFFIYDTNGGTGTGFTKGDILHKIYIGDGEFITS